MYKLLLILKYLRKRRIAWVSLAAVMLCTTMVLVVISVMGGWLRMFRESFHGLSGDIIVQSRTVVGFPYYEEIAERVKALPEVEAAVPNIHTYGLIDIRNYVYEVAEPVQVVGYKIDEVGKVNAFPRSLYRQWGRYEEALADPNTPPAERERARKYLENPPLPSFDLLPDTEVNYRGLAREIAPGLSDPRSLPGMIVGAGLIGIRKGSDGTLLREGNPALAIARLTLVSISPDTKSVDMDSKTTPSFWIVDDSRTQIYVNDKNTVYVPFDVLQKELKMDAYNGEPARASNIDVKVRPGVDLYAVLPKIEDVVARVFAEKSDETGKYVGFPVVVETWEESQRVWIGAIEKEKNLVTMLFGLISIVAIFLIFCIFYMIVQEKTKDIGIIKSVGATSSGVAGIFLGYGLAIGIVGSGLGLLLGWVIVTYINELHALLGQLFGLKIWDPEVYAFDTIPNTMNSSEVIVIVCVAIISSVLGSLVPALRAAGYQPVEALRWE
jgi:lipoprotein-releasing system permease protein